MGVVDSASVQPGNPLEPGLADDDLPSVSTTNCSQETQATKPPEAKFVNGLVDDYSMSETELSFKEDVIHGRPVSVICSTTNEKRVSQTSSDSVSDAPTPDNTNGHMDVEHELVQSKSVNSADDHSGESKERMCLGSENIMTSSLATKYDGPSQQHLTTVIDHEPAENGSSTSTDSGVVAGSPKSDISATPPAGENNLLL